MMSTDDVGPVPPQPVPESPYRPLDLPATEPVWDPFQLMDRLDEDQLRRELEGVAVTDLVYVVKEGGQEVVGLSKQGVDECCMMLVSMGQVVREEDLEYSILGTGEDREALFKVRAARFAVKNDGTEVRLDQVIGTKRQALYHEPNVLDLDTRVPSKKYKGKTYRELLATADGRDYLAWMAENFNESEIRDFVHRILAGEEVVAQRGRQLNPFWFESGAMKAARNARIRLIPGNVRAQVIAGARQGGQARVVDRAQLQGERPRTSVRTSRDGYPEEAGPSGPSSGGDNATQNEAPPRAAEPVGKVGPYSPTEKQIAFYQRLVESPVFTDAERQRALEWLATRATRQTIKDQIDWLKRQVETRKAHDQGTGRGGYGD